MQILKKKKMVIILSLILLLAFIPRWFSLDAGLPYLHYWDEPFLSSSALNIMKTGDITPKSYGIPYGGFTRYSFLLIDWIYFGVSKITNPDFEISDIKTNLDHETNWRELSHGGFYFWNRFFITLLSLGCLIFVFLITKELTDSQILSLLSVLTLFFSENFLYHSSFGNVDMPITFWVLAVVTCTVFFQKEQKLKYLITALIASGFAISTKLNGALVLVVPFTAFLFDLSFFRQYSLLRLIGLLGFMGILPFLIFLLLNPIIYLDWENYFHWTKWILDLYKNGGRHFSKNPGWEHASFQLYTIAQNISWVSFVLALIAAPLSLKPTKLIKPDWKLSTIILIFPLLYMVYMPLNRIAYHRNFLLIYPFFAIYTAYAFFYISKLSNLIFQKNIHQDVISMILIVLFTIFHIPSYVNMLNDTYKIYSSTETRTSAINRLNKLTNDTPKSIVGIAKELRINAEDVNRISGQYAFFEHKNLKEAKNSFNYLLVGNYESRDSISKIDDLKLNQMTKNSKKVDSIIGNTIFRDMIGNPTQNPTIYIIEGSTKYPPPLKPVSLIDKQALYSNHKLIVSNMFLEKGSYVITLEANGKSANNIFPHIKIMYGNTKLKEFYVEKEIKKWNIGFELKSDSKDELYLEFDNDFSNEKEDRNLYIESIKLFNITNKQDLTQDFVTLDAQKLNIINIGEHNLYTNGKLIVYDGTFKLKEGKYTILLEASGKSANSIFPRVKVMKGNTRLKELYVEDKVKKWTIMFEMKKNNSNEKIYLEFDNDFNNEKEDRNLYIKSIQVKTIEK